MLNYVPRECPELRSLVTSNSAQYVPLPLIWTADTRIFVIKKQIGNWYLQNLCHLRNSSSV